MNSLKGTMSLKVTSDENYLNKFSSDVTSASYPKFLNYTDYLVNDASPINYFHLRS